MKKEKKGIRIAICDDSSRDREFIKSVLNEYALGHRDIFLIEEFENGEELLEIQEDVFHLIFLDIYMNSLNGMDVARTLREKGIKSRIVFCSSSKDFAAESYEVDALYYLIKNNEKTGLYQVLDRFFHQYPVGRSIEVKVGKDRVMIALHEIIYAEASNKKCIIHMKDKTVEASVSMSELADMLTLPDFARPIRYAIVSLEEVIAVPTDIVKLSNGIEIPVSRGERQNMKKAFAEYRWMRSKI